MTDVSSRAFRVLRTGALAHWISDRRRVRLLLWKAPEEYHESMCTDLRVNREILAACKEQGVRQGVRGAVGPFGYHLLVQPDSRADLALVHELVDEYRATCLWSLREDYYPTTVEEALSVLDAIERHGDVVAFQKAAEAREWLSRHSSSKSVV